MKITTHRELEVYKLSFKSAMDVFNITKRFPADEKFSLTDQIRRASRSVSANIAEAFRARLYEKSFISKLVITQSEAAEVQTWLEFALECGYINKNKYLELIEKYDHIIAMIVNMIQNSEKWCLRR